MVRKRLIANVILEAETPAHIAVMESAIQRMFQAENGPARMRLISQLIESYGVKTHSVKVTTPKD